MWSYTPVVLGLRRLRQENCKFWASLCNPPPIWEQGDMHTPATSSDSPCWLQVCTSDLKFGLRSLSQDLLG